MSTLMSMRLAAALAMVISAPSSHHEVTMRDQRQPKGAAHLKLAPSDGSPVVDTTPESKRARRRRLARQTGCASHG